MKWVLKILFWRYYLGNTIVLQSWILLPGVLRSCFWGVKSHWLKPITEMSSEDISSLFRKTTDTVGIKKLNTITTRIQTVNQSEEVQSLRKASCFPWLQCSLYKMILFSLWECGWIPNFGHTVWTYQRAIFFGFVYDGFTISCKNCQILLRARTIFRALHSVIVCNSQHVQKIVVKCIISSGFYKAELSGDAAYLLSGIC